MKESDFFDLGFKEPHSHLIIDEEEDFPWFQGYKHEDLPFSLFEDDKGLLIIEGREECISTDIKATKNNISKIVKLFQELE